MDTVKSALRRLAKHEYFPFVVLGAAMSVFYAFATDKYGDDAAFMLTNPLSGGFLNCAVDFYKTWSSRVIIMPVCIYLALLPIAVWRVLDLAVWLTLGVCLSKLFVRNPRTNWFLAGCMLLYPYWHLGSSAWIATTCGYSWPCAFGLFVALQLKRVCENRALSARRWALCALAFIYATDAEQMCAIFLATSACLILRRAFRYPVPEEGGKRYTRALAALFILSSLRMCFTLASRGNRARYDASLFMVPGYEHYTLWRKLRLGFDLAATHYAVCTLGLFITLALLIFARVCRKHASPFKRLAALFPLAFCVICTAIAGLRALQVFKNSLEMGFKRGFANAVFACGLLPDTAVTRFFLLLFIICFFYALNLCYDRNAAAERAAAIGVTALGFSSQWMIGLSPSLYGSALRTFIYASIGIIICAVKIYENLQANGNLPRRAAAAAKGAFIAACAGNYLITFAIGLFKVGAP